MLRIGGFMHQLRRVLFPLPLCWGFWSAAQMAPVATVPAPPKTEVKEVKETIHGVEIVDPYRWLEDQNSPETRRWIDAENSYSKGLLGKLEGRDELEKKVAS